jgi:hypothetical protein
MVALLYMSVMTWAKLVFQTPWYSWLFVEHKPGRATVGRSKWSDGVSTSGMYALRSPWQGKLPWVDPFLGFDTTAVIIVNNREEKRPLVITSADGTGGTVYYKFNLSPLLDDLCELAFRDENQIVQDFTANTEQMILSWAKQKSTKELFKGIAVDGELQKEIAVFYEGDEKASLFEKKRSTAIKSLMFDGIERDATTETINAAETTFDAMAKGIIKLTNAVPAAIRQNLDPDLVVWSAGQVVNGAKGGEPILVFGAKDRHAAGMLEAANKARTKKGN